MIGKQLSSSHHEVKNGISGTIEHGGGSVWKILARRAGENGCPGLSRRDSATFREKDIRRKIQDAREKSERLISFKVNGHDVQFNAKNVEGKINEINVWRKGVSELRRKKRKKK
ncbi:MAG: hypothetical protein AAB507_00665 [Patescibacteria group bacterium]